MEEYLRNMPADYSLTRLAFPQDLQDPTQGHWMNIQAFESGTSTATSVITLFVPGGGQNGQLVWESKYDYAETLLTKATAGVLGVGGVVSALNTVGQMAGGVINPKVEVLFRNVQLRQYQFVFLFAPTSQKESEDMKQIIQLLRFHSAPEIIGESDPSQSYIGTSQFNYLSTSGLMLSPSEFVIDFYHRDENGNFRPTDALPKIARCVIEHIDVNYAPQGQFSTFSNGHPVSAMLTVVFREMRIIGKNSIINGY